MADMSTTALLSGRVAHDPAAHLIAIPDSFGGWFDLTAQEFSDRVRALAKGFVASHLLSGDRLGVLCSNRYESTLVDFAAGLVGIATVPLRQGSDQSELLTVLADADVRGIIVETASDFARFDELRGDLPGVVDAWQIGLGDLDKLADAGRTVTDDELAGHAAVVDSETVAGLYYAPPGDGAVVPEVITHGALVARALGLAEALGAALGPGCALLAILPIVSCDSRIAVVAALATGSRVGHFHESADLITTLGSFRPTVLIASADVYADVEWAAQARAEKAGRSAALAQALDTALEYSRALSAGPVPMGLRTRFAVAETLVLRGLRKAVGGRVAYAVGLSSGTASPPRIRHLMRALDIVPLEGFSTAGSGGVVAVESPDEPFDRADGTVGRVLSGIEASVGDDSRIALRGPGIAMPDDGGWLRTPVVGSLDGGRLRLRLLPGPSGAA